eukprot:91723-Pleurochrysis_carterae.AAC.1
MDATRLEQVWGGPARETLLECWEWWTPLVTFHAARTVAHFCILLYSRTARRTSRIQGHLGAVAQCTPKTRKE